MKNPNFNLLKIRIFFSVVLLFLFSGNTFFYFRSFNVAAEKKQTIQKLELEEAKKEEYKVLTLKSEEAQKTENSSENSNTKTRKNISNSDNSTNIAGSSPADRSDSDVLSAIVAFYADSQSDTDLDDLNHQRVVNYIMDSGADTVFHAGDLLEDGTPESLARFNNVTASLKSSKRFYSAPGNNERNSSVYFNNFNYPGNEHWFSVNVGNLHMIILDNYASSIAIGSEQYNWLLSDLYTAASQSRIIGVMFHYPVYGAGGDTKGMIGTMVPLFRNYGVDFVVSGHEHSYRNNLVDSIRYFVCSGQPSIGYMRAKVYSNRIELVSYNSSNVIIDTVVINNR